jgi:hypothetical protein
MPKETGGGTVVLPERHNAKWQNTLFDHHNDSSKQQVSHTTVLITSFEISRMENYTKP